MFDIMYKLAYKKDVRYNNNNMIYMEGKMKTVFELCKPRESVFVDTTRDDVLNLRNLIENNIDIDKFFDENFMTKGMEILLTTAFKRFKGESETGVIKLTQAMGGGKTHNMLALALLAKNKEWRRKILGKEFDNIGDIKVIAFSGRESDAPYGIWGSLAEQLGKKEVFKDLYTPLKAPGEKAWISLLQGEKTLIPLSMFCFLSSPYFKQKSHTAMNIILLYQSECIQSCQICSSSPQTDFQLYQFLIFRTNPSLKLPE
jgi:hypothetical protein